MRRVRRTVRRSFGRKPVNMQWAGVSGQWVIASAVTTNVILIQLQAPASLAALTSDPPEDLTILRVKGTFSVELDAAASAGNWTLALMVQDVTWTPGATFLVDSDKRVLWHRTYDWMGNAAGNSLIFDPPGIMQDTAAGTVFPCHPSMVEVDIAPKVKVQSGQALYLVAYENIDGVTLTTSSQDMRVLYKRSGRR